MRRGNNVAKYVTNGIAKVAPGTWIRLIANGPPQGTDTVPLTGREWIELQVRGQNSLALAYTNINADGTFTAPAHSAQASKIIPANTIKGEPLSDTVMLWGRSVAKAGASDGGLKVVVTEYR